ncbi:PEGA domain-containing protein [Hyalangium versicolor]|uniref:PEGA domain-containing protein n=1 Tax=Hyalangium versicolor TaxID=2861190 RepID=UPI001CCCFDE8|nr:PEGA domain-containing protein [Hyalangium versicolor]
MHSFGFSHVGLISLSLVLVASPAGAQEGMGLDLSGSDTPQSDSQESTEGDAPQGGMGLDLNSEDSPPDLLPHVVLLGMDTPERAAASVASLWLKELFRAARSNEQWMLTTPPREVREKLGDGYTAALTCAEASCLAEPADTLEADLLVTSRLALEDEGWTFRLWIFDRDGNTVVKDWVTGRNPQDGKFMSAAAELLGERLKALARLRALLVVTVNVPQAVVRLGDKTLGVGSLERTLPPGQATLIVEADEFPTYSKTITLKPGEKNSVNVYLESEGPEPEGPPSEVAEPVRKNSKPSAPTVFSRPALYTAVAGVLAMGVGLVVGMNAQKDAKRQETLSTALLVGGAAVAGGSVLWLVLVPSRSEAPKVGGSNREPGADSGGSSATSLHLVLGGRF